MPDMPIGQLIRLYRIDRKKSVTNISTQIGITDRYLRMIEAGTKTPSLPLLHDIAKVLGVRTSAILGESPSENHEGITNHRLAELERSLVTYRTISINNDDEPLSLDEFSEQFEVIKHSWFTSPNKYSDALRTLPEMIVQVERLVRETNRSPAACGLASETYMLTRAVLKYLGRTDICHLVADRGMRYAEETGNPLLVAAATWNLGHSLLTDDQPEGALDLASIGAEKLDPSWVRLVRS